MARCPSPAVGIWIILSVIFIFCSSGILKDLYKCGRSELWRKSARRSPTQLATLTLKVLVPMVGMTEKQGKTFVLSPNVEGDMMFSYPADLLVLVSHKASGICAPGGLYVCLSCFHYNCSSPIYGAITLPSIFSYISSVAFHVIPEK